MGSSMKLHQFTRGFFEHEQPSLSLGGGGVHGGGGGGGSCSSSSKRLRPLAPKFITNTTTTSSTSTNNSDTTTSSVTAALDLKSFIRPDHNGPRKLEDKRDSTQVEAHAGGTRWNPTQEQIGILEMLYKGGMRTPNAQQIEQITAQLSKYGKIEGKNVFYWFQNHKARERQKQKRNSLGLNHSPRSTNNAPPLNTTAGEVLVVDQKAEEDDNMLQFKRKQRCWAMKCFEAVDVANNINNNFMFSGDDDLQYHQLEDKMTLELFPLHPEARPMKGSFYR